jgi:hypothetical protein
VAQASRSLEVKFCKVGVPKAKRDYLRFGRCFVEDDESGREQVKGRAEGGRSMRLSN